MAFMQELDDAAAAAGYAPSIHNTQPWRWRTHGNQLDLFIDRDRTLKATDPEARLAVLSCGAALNHALIALAADGWRAVVTRLPDPADAGHLATVQLDGRIPVEPESLRHLRTLALRHTDRRPVLGTPVDTDKLRSVVAAVESQGTLMHVLRPDQVFDLAAAADRAQRAESADAAWQAELQFWTGGSRPLGTGVPDAVIPKRLSQTTVPARDFGHPGTMDIADSHDRAAVFAILYGNEDDRLDWLRAGEALSAAWLTATEIGLSVLPLSATVEVTSTRENIRQLLGGLGHPFLVLRFGALDPATLAMPHTPRLSTDQTVERA
jgi:hypothetical protein